MTFAKEVSARLPEGMTLPDPFAKVFDWLEAQGWAGTLDHLDPSAFTSRYLPIYPPDVRETFGASRVHFRFAAGPPMHAPAPEAIARVATIAAIDGTGGTLSFWLDDDGKQRIAVFDHGVPYLLPDGPLIALQFLAMGYLDPGAIVHPAMTPAEHAHFDGYEDDLDGPLLAPTAFRAFLEQTFDVVIPPRASDLGIRVPMEGAVDPVREFMARIEGLGDDPDDISDGVMGFSPDKPFVITKTLRTALSEDAEEALFIAFPYVEVEP